MIVNDLRLESDNAFHIRTLCVRAKYDEEKKIPIVIIMRQAFA